jgi:hypothetical protein
MIASLGLIAFSNRRLGFTSHHFYMHLAHTHYHLIYIHIMPPLAHN